MNLRLSENLIQLVLGLYSRRTDVALLSCHNSSLSFTKIKGSGQKTADQLDRGTGVCIPAVP